MPPPDGHARIRYRRPPGREDVFVQRLVHRAGDVRITYAERTRLRRALVVDGRTVLEDGSPVVWFTFAHRWHDIGRFHLPGGAFSGTYGNVLTPPRFLDGRTWTTTDLFLDVWLWPEGEARLLDEAELDRAEAAGWISARLARRARAEAQRILEAAGRGEWPPPIVAEWDLERVRRALDAGT